MKLVDPADPRFVTGTVDQQRQARLEWYRQRFIAQVMRSHLMEIPRSSLKPLRFGAVEDTTTGEIYRARRDDLADLQYAQNAVAYFFDEHGTPVLLEPRSGTKRR